MKKRFLITILCSGLLFGACTKALDLNPLDEMASEKFFSTKADFDKVLTATYSALQAEQFSYGMAFRDCITDNGYNQFNSGSVNEIVQGNLNPTTRGYVTAIYNDAYRGIGRANLLLSKLETYSGSEMSAENKALLAAEARFIRAFLYFQLYSMYGDVPLILTPLDLDTQRQPSNPAADILKQILADLDFGIQHLSTKAYFANAGHASQSSAQALKARVLLFTGFDNQGKADVTVMTQVRDLCLALMPNYKLSDNFEDVFRDATQKNNTEVVFSVNFLAPNNTAPWDMYLGDWIAASPLQNFVNSFECTDGLPFGVSPLTDTQNPFNNRDPRLAKTVFVDHPDFGGGLIHRPSNPRPTGYGVMKFLDPANLPFGFSSLSQQDAVIIRFAEILLMYAEAQNEILASPDASVYEAMTTLRKRVGMPAYPANYSQAQMRDRIRQERRVELGFEGLRFYDLQRWRTAGQVLNAVKDSKVPYNFQDKFYRWPIPQTEIDKSAGILVQNKDYQ